MQEVKNQIGTLVFEMVFTAQKMDNVEQCYKWVESLIEKAQEILQPQIGERLYLNHQDFTPEITISDQEDILEQL